MKKIEKYKNYILLAFVFSLPLNQKLSTILLVIGALISVLILIYNKTRFKYLPLPYYLITSLFLLNAVYILFSENIEIREIEQRLSLFALPLFFFGFQDVLIKHFHKVLKAFIVGVFVSVVVCFMYAFYNSFTIGRDWCILFIPQINPKYGFFDSVVNGGNHFFSNDFSIFHQSVYYASYLIIAILFLLYKPQFRKIYNYVLIFIFSITIFLVSNRISILILFVVFILNILYSLIKQKIRKKFIFSILASFFIAMLVVLTQPRFIAFFNKFETIGLSYESNDRFDYVSRLMVWESAIELVSDDYILGVGPTNAQIELNKIYKNKNFIHPLSQNLNAHNQYLQSVIEAGLMSLLLLLILLYHFFKVKNSNKYNFLKINIGVLLVIQMLFEAFLNRYSGIVIFSFLFCLFNSETVFLNDSKDK